MSEHKIQVKVVNYPDHKYLMMRSVDPLTGRETARRNTARPTRGAFPEASKPKAIS